MFIEFLFIKAQGTENHTTVHQEKNGYIRCIVFPLEYYIAMKMNEVLRNV